MKAIQDLTVKYPSAATVLKSVKMSSSELAKLITGEKI